MMPRLFCALLLAATDGHAFVISPATAPPPRHAAVDLRDQLPPPPSVSRRRANPVAMGRMPKSKTRPRLPAPPPGSPPALDTFLRWTRIQLAADATSVCVLCLATGETPLQLYYEQSVLLWVLLGPALITFGGVWARITQSDAAEKYDEDDFFVQKLGGTNAVASLRYTISEALRF